MFATISPLSYLGLCIVGVLFWVLYWMKRERLDAMAQQMHESQMAVFGTFASSLPQKPPKLALVCEREDMPPSYNTEAELAFHPFTSAFWSTLVFMADRAFCETDETLLQLLPYVVIAAPGNKIFLYSRGGKGEEGRLHGKLSIGVGGHVDSIPPEGVSLRQWLMREAQREVEEEIGLSLPIIDFVPLGLLNDPTDAVGRVHMGILVLVHLADATFGQLEEGVIENGEFIPFDDLMLTSYFDRMENWSKLAVRTLPNYL